MYFEVGGCLHLMLSELLVLVTEQQAQRCEWLGLHQTFFLLLVDWKAKCASEYKADKLSCQSVRDLLFNHSTELVIV